MRTAYPRSMQWQGGLSRIDRDHSGWVDAAIASAALLASLASVFYVATLVGWAWAVPLNVAPALAIGLRRWAPNRVLAACLGLGLLQWLLAVPFNGAQVASLIALYTVAHQEPRQKARFALGAGLVLVLIAPLRQPYAGFASTVFTVLLVVVIYVLGTNIALRAGYLRALEERAERLEQERDAAARAAAALERTRIAREMHDVVAHHVSVMVVQAEGAGWALDGEPEQARAALGAIAQTGRSTLVELRRLLGVLRAGDSDGVLPQPGLAELPALIDGFRTSGLTVEYPAELSRELPQALSRLPDSLQLAAFRIVQEALTNVLKHAGPGARARIRVGMRPSDEPAALVLEIMDDGIGATGDGGNRSSIGHGLVGIRERAALFDGEVRIGPVPSGGFGVRAVLPAPLESPAPESVPGVAP
jgi:signal transduction histidine kinase